MNNQFLFKLLVTALTTMDDSVNQRRANKCGNPLGSVTMQLM